MMPTSANNGIATDVSPHATLPTGSGAGRAQAAAGPDPTGADPVVQAFRNGANLLNPQELAVLSDAITPEVAAVLTKMLGPEFGQFIMPFASTDQDQAQMPGAVPNDDLLGLDPMRPAGAMGAGALSNIVTR